MQQIEYTSVVYEWKGSGWTQEISVIQQKKDKLEEWEGKYWTDFMNFMAQEQWELVAVVPLGGGQYGTSGIVAYFKRQV